MLQSRQVRTAAVFIVNFHADIELLGRIGRVDTQLRRIRRQRLVPVLSEAGPADRHHHPNAAALEVIDDRSIHADGNPVAVTRIGGKVHQLDGIHKAQHYNIHRGLIRAVHVPINQPPIVSIKRGHIRNRSPAARVAVAMPSSVDLHLSLRVCSCARQYQQQQSCRASTNHRCDSSSHARLLNQSGYPTLPDFGRSEGF